jgi:hypothetical protein
MNNPNLNPFQKVPTDVLDTILSYTSEGTPPDKYTRERSLRMRREQEFKNFLEMISTIETSLSELGMGLKFPEGWKNRFHRERNYFLKRDSKQTSHERIFLLGMEIIRALKQKFLSRDEVDRMYDIILLCIFVQPTEFKAFMATVVDDDQYSMDIRHQILNVAVLYDETFIFLQSDNISLSTIEEKFLLVPIRMQNGVVAYRDPLLLGTHPQFTYITLLNDILGWLKLPENDANELSAHMVHRICIYKSYIRSVLTQTVPNPDDPCSESIINKLITRCKKMLCKYVDPFSTTIRHRLHTLFFVFEEWVTFLVFEKLPRSPIAEKYGRMVQLHDDLTKRFFNSFELEMSRSYVR